MTSGWLRSGETDCDGLRAQYEAEVRPRVAKLAGSPDRAVRQQAELLLKEGLPSPRQDDETVFSGLTCRKGKEG